MKLKANEIERLIASETPSAYLQEERGYYAAFEQHLKVAKELQKLQNFNREGYYSLLFSIECYLKDLFCTIRFKTIGGFNQYTQGQLANLPKTIRTAVINSLKPQNVFGHDLPKLARSLQEFCVDLEGSANYQEFIGLLEPREKWIDRRYDDPEDHIKTDYRQKMEVLEKLFEEIRNNTFERFK